MKRILVSVLIVAALVLALAAPALAAWHTQNWKMDSVAYNPSSGHNFFEMQKSIAYSAQSGHVDIAAGGSATWLAWNYSGNVVDQALANVVFPYGRWDIDLVTDQSLANSIKLGALPGNGIPPVVQVGYVDPTNNYAFTVFAAQELGFLNGTIIPGTAYGATQIQLQLSSVTIPTGKILAVRVNNTDLNASHSVAAPTLRPH